MEQRQDSDSIPGTPVSFSRPRPRPPRSSSQTAKIRVQNRRREYLDKNPAYFASPEHEFADPDLYDKLVRRFLSPAEREAEGRARGWGKTLESSLMRGEARLARVAPSSRSADAASPGDVARGQGGAVPTNFAIDAYLAGDGELDPATRQEGRAAWDEFLRERFVRGGDEEFDYGRVDGDESLDLMEDRDREEAYFDEVEPEWADDSDEGGEDEEGGVDDRREDGVGGGAGGGGGSGDRPRRERILLGQTGIQDY